MDCELEGEELEREIKRYKVVAELQEKVACCEMIRHEFLDDSYKKQKTVFANQTEVIIDLAGRTYKIQYP